MSVDYSGFLQSAFSKLLTSLQEEGFATKPEGDLCRTISGGQYSRFGERMGIL